MPQEDLFHLEDETNTDFTFQLDPPRVHMTNTLDSDNLLPIVPSPSLEQTGSDLACHSLLLAHLGWSLLT